MIEKFSLPAWSARNPLGIIALFISLIYGMSALLLGVSVAKLSSSNQTVLVCFIAAFPFIVLCVFGWLVACHHKKLYGPGDYRSDQGFLNASANVPPAAIGERLRKETDAAEPEQDRELAKEPSEKAKDERAPDLDGAKPQNVAALKRDEDQYLLTYSIENLVFQELQREFGRAIRRGVAMTRPSGSSFHLDGVVEDPSETVLIEVKVLRTLSAIKIVLNREIYKYKAILDEARAATSKPIKFLLAFAYIGQLERNLPEQWIAEAHKQFGDDVLIRFYQSSKLLKKYGFEHPSLTDNSSAKVTVR